MDSAMDGATMDTAPSFNPGQLAGTAVWLDAQETSTVQVTAGKIVRWADRTSHQDNADAVVGHEPTQATYVMTNKPVVRFNQSGLKITASLKPELEWGASTDFLIAIVAAYSNMTGGMFLHKFAAFVSQDALGYMLVGNIASTGKFAFGLNYQNTSGVTDSTASNDGKMRLYVAMRTMNGTHLAIRVNGAETVAMNVTALDVSSMGYPIVIGAYDPSLTQQNGAQFITADIGEIVLVKGSLSAFDLASLEGYLKTKWQLQ